MGIGRLAVALGCLSHLLSACGCPTDRAPSGIVMTLPPSLGETYLVEVCVDSTCDTFDVVGETGRLSPDGQVELERLSSGETRYTSWREIAPGVHDVVVNVSEETGTIATFDGTVEFDAIDRCHDGDSEAAIDLVASQ
jgi:hypothetical protein